MKNLTPLYGLVLIFKLIGSAGAADVDVLLREELTTRYPGAQIQVQSIQWKRGPAIEHPLSVFYLGDDGRGVASFRVHGRVEMDAIESECTASFAAMTRVPYAKRRINPGSILAADVVDYKDVNLALNPLRQFKELIAVSTLPWSTYEARAVLIENQPILRTQIDLVPLIRAGANVKIKIVSNDLTVWSRGTVQDSGSLDQEVRVLSLPAKRSLNGVVRGPDVVEVKL